jgi:hypothetical protein
MNPLSIVAGISVGLGVGILLLLTLYTLIALSPAILAFGRAWHYYKVPALSSSWHKRPIVLITLGVFYILGAFLFLRAGDVLKAKGILSRYSQPVYAINDHTFKLKAISFTAGSDGPGEEIYEFYSSPYGDYSVIQMDYIMADQEFIKSCFDGNACVFIDDTFAGKAFYYEKTGEVWINTEKGYMQIHPYDRSVGDSPQTRRIILQTLQELKGFKLWNTILMRVTDY